MLTHTYYLSVCQNLYCVDFLTSPPIVHTADSVASDPQADPLCSPVSVWSPSSILISSQADEAAPSLLPELNQMQEINQLLKALTFPRLAQAILRKL